ncbi:hypothetical protein GCM10027035_22830 [Emticicia sediminis]
MKLLFAQAQIRNEKVLNIKLERQFGIENLTFRHSLGRFEKENNYIGYPKNIDTMSIVVFDMHQKQSIYQRYKNNEISSVTFKRLETSMRIDTNLLSVKYVKQAISFFVGFKGVNKVIICDTNNNWDFSDEQIMFFDTTSKHATSQTLVVKNDFYDGNKVVTREINVKIDPIVYNQYEGTNLEQKLQIDMGIYEHRLGYFSLDNQEYKIALNIHNDLNGTYKNSNIFIAKKNEKFEHHYPKINSNQITQLLENNIKVTNISILGDSLKIIATSSGSEANYGNQKGNFFPFSQVTTINDKVINFSSIDTEYVLLDFWGTWCAPCIKDLPLLKSFHERFKSRVKIISIAYDNNKQNTIKFIKQNEMVWENVFIDRNSQDIRNIVLALRVDCFPSFILIDNKNKIISNECSSLGLKKIENILLIR